jgi:hypothetical protein
MFIIQKKLWKITLSNLSSSIDEEEAQATKKKEKKVSAEK